MKSILIAATLCVCSCFVSAQQPKDKIPAEVEKLLQKYACLACHNVGVKLIGPAYAEVARKNYTAKQIVDLIYNPKPANWPGYPPMSPMKHVPAAEALKIANWIGGLNKKK